MASAVIGALRANLGLDSAQFHKGASDAQKSLAQLRGRFLAVGGAALAFGTALSAAALRGADGIDKAVKSARRIDASLGSFRALEMAAGEAGVPVDQIATSVQTMNRELAKGGKAPAEALAKLGLAASDLEGLDADEKLAVIADGIKAMGMDAGEASAVLQALGVRSKEMVLAMIAGGDVFRDARADVQDYGLALSSVQTDAIEKANDQIGRLSLVGTYLGDQLAMKIVPALGMFAQAMTDSLREGGLLRAMIDGFVGNLDRMAAYIGVAVVGFGTHYVAALVAARLATMSLAGSLAFLRGAIMRTGVGLLVIGAAELVLALGRIVTKVGGVGAAMEIMGRVAAGVWKGIGIAAGAVPLALESVWQSVRAGFFTMIGEMQLRWYKFIVALGQGALSAGMTELAATFGAYAESVGTSLDETTAAADAASAAAAAAGEAAKGALTDGLETARAAAAELSAEVKRTGEDAAGAAGGVGTLGDGLDDLGGGGAGGGGKASKAQEALKGLREELTRLSDTMRMTEAQERVYNAIRDAGVTATSAEGQEIGQLVPEIDRLTQAKEGLRSAASAMKSSLQGAFTGLISGAQSFNDALGNVIASLAEMAANAAFQSLWNSVSGNALFSGLGAIFGVGANANGTSYWQGGLTSVNERGGEIINLPRGSQVIPHDISKEMARDAAGGGGARVEVVPSAYFDVVVQQGAARVAAPMVGGAMRAQSRGYGARQSSYDMRGTTT